MPLRTISVCAASAAFLILACSLGDKERSPNAEADSGLSLDSLRCASITEARRCDLYNASVQDLTTRPADYHGRRVRVIGYAHLEFEGNGLYARPEDQTHGLSLSGVWLEPPPGNKINNSYVILEGRFDAKSRGHMGMWAGSIDSVTRFEAWRW